MISIVGIGNAASNIAEMFSSTNNYDVYCLNNSVKRKTKRKFKLKDFEKPEDYETNTPDLEKFFSAHFNKKFYFFDSHTILFG